jgi:hypothetical protein
VSEASPGRWPAALAVTRVREDGWRAWREIRLAALADARARAFYEGQRFLATGRSRTFPGSADRLISEMSLDLAEVPGRSRRR